MNATNCDTRVAPTRRQGSAMVVVVCLAGLTLLVTFSMTMMAGSMARKSKMIHKGVQALSIAEAGVADVIQKMSTNYYPWSDAAITSDFAGGTYVVSTRTDFATAHVTIWSEGTIDGTRRETVVELLGDLYALYDQSLSPGAGLLSHGNITVETAAVKINGKIHTNGDLLHTRGNTKINGDISASGIVQLDVTSGHTTTDGVKPMVVPDFQPFDVWRDMAIANGIYYKKNTKLANVHLNPPNGIVYVEGDVEVVNQSWLVGTLVAAGSITINNRFYQTPFNTDWPALLAGMNVSLNNRNSYEGVIFAGNNIVSRNNRYIHGALLALNMIYVEDGCTIDPIEQPPAWSPIDTNNLPPIVTVGGWLR